MATKAELARDVEIYRTKIVRCEAEREALYEALEAAEQALANAPEDVEETPAGGEQVDGGVGASGVGAAHNPTVMVVNNINGDA